MALKIGIMGAMIEEVQHLQHAVEQPVRLTRGQRDYVSGRMGGHEVVVVFSRWGKVAAAATAATLIERFDVNCILFTGVAGALDPRLNIGDIVVGRSLVQHDLDASAVPGIERFEVPLLGVRFFEPDGAMVDKAAAAARAYLQHDMPGEIDAATRQRFAMHEPRVYTGLIASGDQFIASAAHAAELRQALPEPLCVEMEGAAVAQVAYEHGLPFLVLRTISDKADHSAPIDFPPFIAQVASPIACGCARHLLALLD